MNLHLHHVVSDVNGVSGLRILDAILEGERDPKVLIPSCFQDELNPTVSMTADRRVFRSS